MVSPVTCPDTYFDPRFTPFTENMCTEWLAWRKQTKYLHCRMDTVIPSVKKVLIQREQLASKQNKKKWKPKSNKHEIK
jgi:hypothetical protein